jgi:hypothetical protein
MRGLRFGTILGVFSLSIVNIYEGCNTTSKQKGDIALV